MIDVHNLPDDLALILTERFGADLVNIHIPPSSFVTMKGAIIEYDLNSGYLKTEFPILETFLNQFGNMQGGIICAAIDNTLGPLSILIAPPNFTRKLEVKFRKPINPAINSIYVEARLVSQRNRMLEFSSKVLDKNDTVYATANASHWILPDS